MEFDMTQHNFLTQFEYSVDWVNKRVRKVSGLIDV
jgi:hypothetical protein